VLQGHELVVEYQFRFVQQPADERRLAVIDRPAGDEAQQALALVRAQVRVDVAGDEIGLAGRQK
jgi:hypothetical protein